MNPLRRFFLLALLAATSIHPLFAQWVQTNGPYGGFVRSLAVSGTNLFAGTDGGGVFLSTNNGTSWTQVNTGLTNTDVRSLAVSGTNLFAGTDGGGVFLSTN
ncbi:MAG: regulator, partial [Bacteroidota bacterium]